MMSCRFGASSCRGAYEVCFTVLSHNKSARRRGRLQEKLSVQYSVFAPPPPPRSMRRWLERPKHAVLCQQSMSSPPYVLFTYLAL
eukprot:6208377-Pleurochrysis_carterae.AAC.3